MIKRIVLVFFWLGCSLAAFAQLSHDQLASLYYTQATVEENQNESLALYKKALLGLETAIDSLRIRGQEIPVNWYYNAALCAIGVSDYNKTTFYAQQMLDDCAAKHGTNSVEYARRMQNVSRLAWLCKDYKQSLSLIEKSDKCFRVFGTGTFAGRDTLDYVNSLLIHGSLTAIQGKTSVGLRKVKEAVRVEKECYLRGESSEGYRKALEFAYQYCSIVQPGKKANEYLNQAFYIYERELLGSFNQMSEVRRELYWKEVSKSIDNLFDVFSYKGRAAEVIYDMLLLSKGILLKTSRDFSDFVRTQGDSIALTMLENLNRKNLEGASNETLHYLDQQLVDYLNEKGAIFSSNKDVVRWQDVQEALGPDDIAIEFYYKKKEYRAAFVKKGWAHPEIVSFYPYKGKWSIPYELRKHFPITKDGRIFFSSDAAFDISPFEYSEIQKGQYLADVFPVYRLSSTREVVLGKARKEGSVSGLYGGVLYTTRDAQRKRMRVALKEGRRRNLDTSILKNTSAVSRFMRPLTKSLREVQSVDSVLQQAGYQVDLFTGPYASEESFNAMAREEQLIHIATHGFYVRASEANENNGLIRVYSLERLIQDPMLRTGLYMAGVNQISTYAERPGEHGGTEADGVLSAKEISMMDLRGTELVVLSACETGLGDDGIDGLVGLQRAFKKAGVQSMVLSLKEVDDECTSFLMQRFYENYCLMSLSLHDAFYAAIRQLRVSGLEKAEQNWNAFILLDAYSSCSVL